MLSQRLRSLHCDHIHVHVFWRNIVESILHNLYVMILYWQPIYTRNTMKQFKNKWLSILIGIVIMARILTGLVVML